MYFEETNDIQISVQPHYVAERSNPSANYYFFIYQVQIKNCGTATSKLLSRHWIITDGKGRVEEVHGDGVVGEQPNLAPGESFVYTSACPLGTPTGNMRGSYRMMNATGQKFDARIPVFFLRDVEHMH